METIPRFSAFVAECYWTGVTDADVRQLDARADAAAVAVSREGQRVTYLGSILMPADEVVFCLFEGSADAVRRAVVRAQIPSERLAEGIHSRIHRP